jgi:hypothetical protein
MQSSFDGLLIALLVVLAPDQDTQSGERTIEGFQFAPAIAASRGRDDPAAACSQFFDAGARRNCEIRIGRERSGSAEGESIYPETLFWVTPSDPAMPFKFGTNPQR